MVLWSKAEVQRQFVQGGQSNIHEYEGLSGQMQEHRHNWLVRQCCIKIKVL